MLPAVHGFAGFFAETERGTAVWETEAHSERIHCCEWLEDDSIATGSEDSFVFALVCSKTLSLSPFGYQIPP